MDRHVKVVLVLWTILAAYTCVKYDGVVPEHEDHNPAGCDKDVTYEYVERMRAHNRTVCQDKASGISIVEYSDTNMEYSPTVLVFRNAALSHDWKFLKLPFCDPDTRVSGKKPPWVGQSEQTSDVKHVETIENRVIFIVHRFDAWNVYEAFHSYLNTFAAFKLMRLEPDTIQFVLDDKFPEVPNDAAVWKAISGHPPIFTSSFKHKDIQKIVKAPLVVEGSFSGTSLIVTKTKDNVLRGRGTDTKCKSSFFRGAVHFLRHRLGVEEPDGPRKGVFRVVWSSRQKYIREGKLWNTHRILANEEQFMNKLRENLGSGYVVEIVDFARKSTRDSIQIATQSDVIVGVHGAGLVWSSFLPRHSGLVEIFGGDRGTGNRHYHNIAAFADIHHRSLRMNLDRWVEIHPVKIAQLIRGIPLRTQTEPAP